MADEQNSKNGYRVIEWFRFITPVLVTVSLFIVTSLKSDIEKIDNKLFAHLTNDEIHIPREYVVTKAEFDLHCKYKDEQIKLFNEAIKNLRQDLLIKWENRK